MGRISRQRGKLFELRCARLLPSLLEHDRFKRTGSRGTQPRGDIVPVDERGAIVPALADRWYIECRLRSRLSSGMIRRWIQEVLRAGHYAEHRWLLFAQLGGPVFALYCDLQSCDKDWPLRCTILEDDQKDDDNAM